MAEEVEEVSGENVNESSSQESQQQPARTRNCNECGKEYPFTRSTSKFCTNKCKDIHNAKIRANNMGATPAATPQKEKPVDRVAKSLLAGLDPATQIAVDLLKEDRDNWKTQYKDAVDEKKALEATVKELEKQLLDKQHTLQGLEDQQPNAVQKFLGSIPSAWTEAMAPAFGEVAKKLVALIPSGGGGMAGVNGQLDAEQNTKLEDINKWFCVIPKELQDQVYNILGVIATADTPEKLNDILTKISNLLNNGTTIQSNQQQQYSSNFGFSPTGT